MKLKELHYLFLEQIQMTGIKTESSLDVRSALDEMDRKHRRISHDTAPHFSLSSMEVKAVTNDFEFDDFKRISTHPFAALRVVPISDSKISSAVDNSISALYPLKKIEKVTMRGIETALAKMNDVTGFMGAIALLPTGEELAQVGPSSLKLTEVGAISNDVLLRAHSSARLMDVGDSNIAVELEAERALILLSCLSTHSGVHIHLCFVMTKTANIGMAKIWLGRVKKEITKIMN